MHANATVTTNNTNVATTMHGVSENFALNNLNPEQWQTLFHFLSNQNLSNDSMTGEYDSWIIDTGASNHVTRDLTCLTQITNVPECPVGLPDGQKTVATKEGSVTLAGEFILKNVLYVPKLKCSLISVSQLIDAANCNVQFTNSLCAIHDQSSRMLIGAGERRDGLYYFRGVPRVKALTIDGLTPSALWHKRLGHPSDKVLKLVPNIGIISDSKKMNKACDICHRAKQTRDCFPISNHTTTKIFELIHCDLWGPYRTPSSCGASYFFTIVDDYSRAVWIYLLLDKTEVHKTFMSFFAMV